MDTAKKGQLVGINEQGRRVGEGHPNAKLSDHEVDLVLDLHDQGYGYRRLARKFEVPHRTIRDICNYKRRCQRPTRFKKI